MSSRCMRAGLLVLAAGLLAGCGEGEVTTLVLPVSPDNGEQFVAARQAMLTVGCGIVGCHATIVGNFQVTDQPGAQQDEYLMAKKVIDQEAPGESVLLTVALADHPTQVNRHPACFANTEGCAWRILTAWISDPADPEATASAIAETCTPLELACRQGGD